MDKLNEKRLSALMTAKKIRSRLKGLLDLNDMMGGYSHLSLDLFGVFQKEVEELLLDINFISTRMEEENEQA